MNPRLGAFLLALFLVLATLLPGRASALNSHPVGAASLLLVAASPQESAPAAAHGHADETHEPRQGTALRRVDQYPASAGQLRGLAAFPTALIFVLGSVALALLPKALRASALPLVPFVALAQIATQLYPAVFALGGDSAAVVRYEFLAYQLEVVHADRLSLIFGSVFALIGTIAGVYALHNRDLRQQIAALLYSGGAVGVTFAGDLFTLYAYWELMAVASTVLIWAQGSAASARAGNRYILVHIAGGAVLLAGIVLHVNETGSVLFHHFPAFDATLATWLMLIGVCVNAAVPPLGAWLPDAYPRATVTGAIFMSSLTTKTAVYVLLRGFAGWEILIPFGVMMALYGVVYAVLANDIRELLAYHIISQVGYMVAGAGMGTEMAVNGATAHAVCHILYKSLLFMGAGVVIATTGRRKLTELGGFVKRQKLAFGLYMIGAFSISGFPLFNGFVSKSMVVAAAGADRLYWAYLLLTLASVGTFLHTGLKLPYFTWMGKDRGIQPQPARSNMIVAMAFGAFFCTLLGVWPGLLYAYLPFAVDYNPYNVTHLIESIQILLFTGFAFYLFIPKLGGEATISMDTDVLYRKTAPVARALFVTTPAWIFTTIGEAAEDLARAVATLFRDPTRWGKSARADAPTHFDPNRSRQPLVIPLTLTLAVFAWLALLSLRAF